MEYRGFLFIGPPNAYYAFFVSEYSFNNRECSFKSKEREKDYHTFSQRYSFIMGRLPEEN